MKKRLSKNYQKTGNNIYIKWKGYDNLFNRSIYKKTEFLPRTRCLQQKQNNVEVYSSYYATKSDLKEAKDVNTSKLAAKGDLPSLKLDVNELDIDKSKIITMKN